MKKIKIAAITLAILCTNQTITDISREEKIDFKKYPNQFLQAIPRYVDQVKGLAYEINAKKVSPLINSKLDTYTNNFNDAKDLVSEMKTKLKIYDYNLLEEILEIMKDFVGKTLKNAHTNKRTLKQPPTKKHVARKLNKLTNKLHEWSAEIKNPASKKIIDNLKAFIGDMSKLAGLQIHTKQKFKQI